MTNSSPEQLLAKAFDNLVESSGNHIPFSEMAMLVAKFTKLYIQNLFQLSEMDFAQVMRNHCKLHAKADRIEKRGGNPLLVLQRQIEKRDNLGRILAKYAHHLGALDCILDVRATAALIHHMVMLKPEKKLPAAVTGCEMGSGTGVLSIAGSIPFISSGNHITIHGFEQSVISQDDATLISQILQENSRYSGQFQIHFNQGDITEKTPYTTLSESISSSGPLALWISETFGHRSKRPVVKDGDTVFSYEEPDSIMPYSSEEENIYDPLPQVLDLSCRYFKGFIHKVKSKEIAAFPDIVTPEVMIDGTKSSFLSADGTWRKLHEIGAPYDMLPTCVPSRWHISEDTKDENKSAIGNKTRKKRKKKKYHTR